MQNSRIFSKTGVETLGNGIVGLSFDKSSSSSRVLTRFERRAASFFTVNEVPVELISVTVGVSGESSARVVIWDCFGVAYVVWICAGFVLAYLGAWRGG